MKLGSFIGDKQRADFQQDGVLALKGVLNTQEVALLRSAVDKQMAEYGTSATAYDFQDIAEQIWEDKEEPLKLNGATRFDMEYYRNAVRKDRRARPLLDKDRFRRRSKGRFFYQAAGWRKYRGIRQVAMDSALPEICASLLDTAYVNFWEDTTFVKTPGASQRTAFHQDKAYFQISGNKCCIVWIPLDLVNAENGAVEYVLGSHRWGREYAPNVFFAQTSFPDSDAAPLPDIEGEREKYNIRRVDAEPGDVIIHHVLTVHGAGGNISADSMRRGISFRYCGDDVRYCDRPGAIPQPWVTDKLKDGDELFSRDYPRVWPRPFPGAKLSRLYG